jgi:hypothetical protein
MCRTMVTVLAIACMCVTCCSSMAAYTYPGMEAEFGVGRLVCVLSVSLFVAGLGTGPRECARHRPCYSRTRLSADIHDQTNEPVVLGPISEFIGRKKVLHYSFGAFFCGYMSVYNNDAAS